VATARLALSRAQHPRSRRLRPISLAISVVVAGLAAVAGPVTAGHATPQLSISEVQARIDALNERAEKITETYNLSRDRLTALKREQKSVV